MLEEPDLFPPCQPVDSSTSSPPLNMHVVVSAASEHDKAVPHNFKASSVTWCTDYLQVMGCEKPHNFKVMPRTSSCHGRHGNVSVVVAVYVYLCCDINCAFLGFSYLKNTFVGLRSIVTTYNVPKLTDTMAYVTPRSDTTAYMVPWTLSYTDPWCETLVYTNPWGLTTAYTEPWSDIMTYTDPWSDIMTYTDPWSDIMTYTDPWSETMALH